MMYTNLVPIAETIVAIEVSLILSLFVVAYLFKGYLFVKQQIRTKKKIKLEVFWQHAKQNPKLLTQNIVKVLQREIIWVLSFMQQEPSLESAPAFYEKVIHEVLLPSGRKLIKKRNYLQKYYASICFYYKFELQDERYLLRALSHPVSLVSLNAARAIFRHGSVELLEKAIKHFAAWHWLQQEVIAQIVLEERVILTRILLAELQKDKTHSVRTFCYKLLCLLPFGPEAMVFLEEDLFSPFLDLRVASLNYLIKAKDNAKLRPFLQDSDWVIREKTAKALGILQDEESIASLTRALFDPEWWVRIRSAEALLCFGEKGVAILNQPHIQSCAAAKETLSRYEHRQKRI